VQSKPLNEYPLEGKSGASSRGNSSSNSVYLIVAVKKLVVGPWVGSAGPPHGVHRPSCPFCRRCAPGLNWPGRASGAVTLKKLECSKQAYALNTLAWDNITRISVLLCLAFGIGVMINRDSRGAFVFHSQR
ncbi:hypothetical protein LINPERHAP2_LOCUS20473, partial [Linum perenne]